MRIHFLSDVFVAIAWLLLKLPNSLKRPPLIQRSLSSVPKVAVVEMFNLLYYYMRNFCNLIGLDQWYFSLIWNTYMWKITNLLLVQNCLTFNSPIGSWNYIQQFWNITVVFTTNITTNHGITYTNRTHPAKRLHVRFYCSLTRYLSVFFDNSGKCSSITKSTTFLKENKKGQL